MLTLEEVKIYLRVDDDDFEDALIEGLMTASEALCLDVIRGNGEVSLVDYSQARLAFLYAVAYLYEHREEANHQELTLTLRALLFGVRQEEF